MAEIVEFEIAAIDEMLTLSDHFYVKNRTPDTLYSGRYVRESDYAALNERYESLLLHSQEYDELAKKHAALRAEVERLKADIQEENDKLSLAAFRNLKQHLALECDRIAQAYDIRFSSEKQLRADLAAAVEVLRELFELIEWRYPDHRTSLFNRARALLARMEVKP